MGELKCGVCIRHVNKAGACPHTADTDSSVALRSMHVLMQELDADLFIHDFLYSNCICFYNIFVEKDLCE